MGTTWEPTIRHLLVITTTQGWAEVLNTMGDTTPNIQMRTTGMDRTCTPIKYRIPMTALLLTWCQLLCEVLTLLKHIHTLSASTSQMQNPNAAVEIRSSNQWIGMGAPRGQAGR